MRIELVYLADCPHRGRAVERLREAMTRTGLDPETLEHHGVVTEDAPPDFPGSPTIVIEGRDPFPNALPAGPTCRRYETERGTDGSPSVSQLVDAIARSRSDA